jgi:hypothetical protein
MSIVQPQEKRLAEAVTLLVAAIHQAFPTVSIRPIPSYEDEDFTLEVRIPAGMDRDTVMSTCIQQAMNVEDRFGFAILTRVKAA